MSEGHPLPLTSCRHVEISTRVFTYTAIEVGEVLVRTGDAAIAPEGYRRRKCSPRYILFNNRRTGLRAESKDLLWRIPISESRGGLGVPVSIDLFLSVLSFGRGDRYLEKSSASFLTVRFNRKDPPPPASMRVASTGNDENIL